MIIVSLNIYLPVGTHSYNGFIWIVCPDKILKSKVFYNNLFDTVYLSTDSSIGAILGLELKGLARTIASK